MHSYTISVSNSENAYIVDNYGLELYFKYNWFATHGDYPYLRAKVNGRVIKFHIELMRDEIVNKLTHEPNSHLIVDHINGDILDNRKSNLRVRTQSENNMNKKVQSNNTSGIVGVSWSNKAKMWQVYISMENKRINLGSFYYLRNAVRTRIEAEERLFGEHSYKNRSKDYNSFINSILNMPKIKEPIFTKRSGNYNVNGVFRCGDKFKVRMFKDGKEKSLTFNDLESAIKHREEFEINTYGVLLTFLDTKKDRQI